MPLYLYRLQPALAVAFAATYRPGEWTFALRARSVSTAVELGLTGSQAEALRCALVSAAARYEGGRFPLGKVRPRPADDPLLRTSHDLEAKAEQVSVICDPRRRMMTIRASGRAEAVPFQVDISAIPEQMLALAEQIETVRLEAGTICPICGRALKEPGAVCTHGVASAGAR